LTLFSRFSFVFPVEGEFTTRRNPTHQQKQLRKNSISHSSIFEWDPQVGNLILTIYMWGSYVLLEDIQRST